MTSIAQRAADALIGTPGLFDVDTWAEENNVKMTLQDMYEFDSLAFICEVCGWWCGEDEREDGETCIQCADEH
jgi:hypothetical protein